jgi:hypothetical protein
LQPTSLPIALSIIRIAKSLSRRKAHIKINITGYM